MSDTKQDILNLAEHLIRSRGYHAFSDRPTLRNNDNNESESNE